MRGWLAKTFGNRGERLAAKHLRKLGYKILARQHRSRLGELDIIARDGDCMVFVEVKTRRSHAAGSPTESITTAKQSQITRLALEYLKRHQLLKARSRFDVIAITWPETNEKPELMHYKNAFEPVGQGQMFS